MKEINCIVVDDEPIAREIIESHLEKIPDWVIKSHCINAEEAYEALLKEEVDVVFLDIEMPVISGVEFLQSLKNPPLVIFTTAYSKYAMKGYDLNIVDYLLKPINFDRFFQAILKANELLKSTDQSKKAAPSSPKYFFVKHGGKLTKITFQDIIYVKAEQEYSSILTTKGTVLASMHLKLILQVLPQDDFTRVHRSYVVPHHKIASISGATIEMETGNKLPIGSTYRETLLKKLSI